MEDPQIIDPNSFKMIQMTKCLNLLLLISFMLACTADKSSPSTEKEKNEVLVLGTIHGGHLTDSVYNNAYVEKLIREINPDFILAEIPPDRMDAAMAGFIRNDSISEPRVMRFPEYVDVVFPLTKSLDFEIIPTAGWTAPMAQERSEKLRAISQNPERIEDWKAYQAANQLSDSVYKATLLHSYP